MAFDPWYIQTLTGDRGTEVSKLYLISCSWNETVNEKKSFNAQIPYSDEIVIGRWFYLRHASDDAAWFYGQVEEVSSKMTTDRGRVTTFKAYCNLKKLSDIAIGVLNLFDWGYRTPSSILELDTTQDPKIEAVRTLPFTWTVHTGSGNDFGGHTGIDTVMIGDDVPYTDIQITMSDPVDSGNTHITGADFRVQYLNNEEGWEDQYRPTGDPLGAKGTDGTNELTQSGTFTPDADISGVWDKNSQIGINKFWTRIWFKRGDFYGSGETVTFSNIQINRRVPTDTAIDKIMALLSGWTASSNATRDDVYHQFRGGETAIEAFRLVSRMTGGYFVNGSLSADVIGWEDRSNANLTNRASAPIALMQDPSQTVTNATKVQLVGVSTKSVAPEATRLTIYGAGFGQQILTAKLQDLYTSGGVVSGSGFEYTFTTGGNTYTYNTDTNLLVNTTAETALGRAIHVDLEVPYVSSLYASGESVEQANQLLRMAIRHLEKVSRSDRVAYTATAMNMSAPITVGQSVRLIYDDGDFSVDDAFVVARSQHTFNGSGFRATLLLTDDGYSIDSDTGYKQDATTLTQHRTRYPQPMHTVNIEGSRSGGFTTIDPNLSPYVHPNHSGHIVSVADGDTIIQPAAIFDQTEDTSPGANDFLWTRKTDGTLAKLKISTLESNINPDHTGHIVSGGDGVTTIQPAAIFDQTEDTTPGANDFFITRKSDGTLKKVKVSSLEANISPDHGNHTGDVTSVDLVTTLASAAITGKSALTSPNTADTILVYDESAGGLVKVNLGDLQTLINVHGDHTGDVASSGLVTTLQSVAIGGQTEITSVGDNDLFLTLDATDGLLKRVKFSSIESNIDYPDHGNHSGHIDSVNLVTTINQAAIQDQTEDTTPADNDFLLTRKADGSLAKLRYLTLETDLAYTHPNHSGDIVSVADGATTAQPALITGKTLITEVAEDNDLLLVYSLADLGLRSISAANLVDDALTATFRGDTTPSTPLRTNPSGRFAVSRLGIGAMPSTPIDATAESASGGIIRARNTASGRIVEITNNSENGSIYVYDSSGNQRVGFVVNTTTATCEIRDSSLNRNIVFSDSGQLDLTTRNTTTVPLLAARADAGASGDVIRAVDDTSSSTLWSITWGGNLDGITQWEGVNRADYLNANTTELASVPNNRIIGNVSGATAASSALTKAQVLTMINVEDGAQVNEATTDDAHTNPSTILKPDANGRFNASGVMLGSNVNPSDTYEIRRGDGTAITNLFVGRSSSGTNRVIGRATADGGGEFISYLNGVGAAYLQAFSTGGRLLLRNGTTNIIELDANSGTAQIIVDNLPTSYPSNADQLWKDSAGRIVQGDVDEDWADQIESTDQTIPVGGGSLTSGNMTIPHDGRYLISLGLEITTTADGNFEMKTRVGGSDIAPQIAFPSIGGESYAFVSSYQAVFDENETVGFKVTVTGTGATIAVARIQVSYLGPYEGDIIAP